MSPTQQINKSEGGTGQLPVEPDAEIVQGGLGRPAWSESPPVGAGAPSPARGHGRASQRLFLRFGVSRPASGAVPWAKGLAVGFGRRDQPGAIAVLPPLMPLPSLEALVRHIPSRPFGKLWRRPQGGQPGMGVCRKAKKSSASLWSLALAGAKLKPVMTPWGLTESSR